MPAETEKQREAMAIAEHHPEKLYKKNKGLLKMNKEQLHDFAKTKGLKKHKPKKKWHEQ
jgi:hypothetical protein